METPRLHSLICYKCHPWPETDEGIGPKLPRYQPYKTIGNSDSPGMAAKSTIPQHNTYKNLLPIDTYSYRSPETILRQILHCWPVFIASPISSHALHVQRPLTYLSSTINRIQPLATRTHPRLVRKQSCQQVQSTHFHNTTPTFTHYTKVVKQCYNFNIWLWFTLSNVQPFKTLFFLQTGLALLIIDKFCSLVHIYNNKPCAAVCRLECLKIMMTSWIFITSVSCT